MLLPATVVLLLVSCTCGENPAIQITLSNKGLEYGKHVGADWIQEILENLTLPDMSGKVAIGCFGSIYYMITGTSVRKCDLPEPTVEFCPNVTGLKASMSGLSIALGGGWEARYGLIRVGGTFDMAVFSVDVTSVVRLGKDVDGHLSVSSVSCDARVGNVVIRVRGGVRWVFQKFVNRFQERIRRKIETSICPNVEEIITNLESHLQAMNVSFDVDEVLALNLSLTDSPVVNASSLTVGLKGEFYRIKTHEEPPFDVQPFTVPQQKDYMLSLGLSESTLNSASYGYYSAGLFHALINDSTIPPDFPVHLNTSAMGPYVPQLPQKFPGLPMTLEVHATEVPMFTFQPGAVNLGLQEVVNAFAVQKNCTQTALFKLRADSNFRGKVWVDAERLKGFISVDNFTLTLISSEVGPVKIDALENCTRGGLDTELKKLNDKLAKGIALPRMKQAELTNSVLKVEQGFIAFFSDAKVYATDGRFNQQKNTHE